MRRSEALSGDDNHLRVPRSIRHSHEHQHMSPRHVQGHDVDSQGLDDQRREDMFARSRSKYQTGRYPARQVASRACDGWTVCAPGSIHCTRLPGARYEGFALT
jgi:hypothetical protein